MTAPSMYGPRAARPALTPPTWPPFDPETGQFVLDDETDPPEGFFVDPDIAMRMAEAATAAAGDAARIRGYARDRSATTGRRSMPVPFSGGCACGAVRYTCSEEPFVSYACHCTECQKRTGAAFGISIQVPSGGLAVDEGEPKVRRRVADSGNEIDVRFCGGCGTSVFAGGPARPHVRVVFVGTLDDPGWVPIQANIWTRSALPWVHLDPQVERFEMLPDFAKYFENR